MKNEMVTCRCRVCNQNHEMPKAEVNTFGRDAECMKCVNRAHRDFMRRNAKRLGLTCVPGCQCGFGK